MRFNPKLTISASIAVLIITGCGAGGGSSNTSSSGDAASTAAAQVDSTCGIPNFRIEMLAVINAARAAGAVCGSKTMAPVGPLAWNNDLNNAATVMALDLVKTGVTGSTSANPHTSSDGKTPADRARAAGYAFSTLGENIGWGYSSPEESLHSSNGWMPSPSHCENIMQPQFNEVAVSCVKGGNFGTVFVMDLGAR